MGSARHLDALLARAQVVVHGGSVDPGHMGRELAHDGSLGPGRATDRKVTWHGGEGDKIHPVSAPVEPPDATDALHSITHRANDIGMNLSHARNHLLNVMKSMHSGDTDSALWNADHAQKHMLEAEEVARKLAAHMAVHPELVKEYRRLQADNPINQVIDPSMSQSTGSPKPAPF